MLRRSFIQSALAGLGGMFMSWKWAIAETRGEWLEWYEKKDGVTFEEMARLHTIPAALNSGRFRGLPPRSVRCDSLSWWCDPRNYHHLVIGVRFKRLKPEDYAVVIPEVCQYRWNIARNRTERTPVKPTIGALTPGQLAEVLGESDFDEALRGWGRRSRAGAFEG